ncbi:hypothetical protein [Gilliamella sp. Gris3-2]|uniref:hypothetical protein n=2 Tax=Gilliamella TaxID=1193503 RepID=UPI00080E2FD3|nr:hypothetical protein [Gilliamella apicola]OCG38184.1 hypothetical protein A9G32_01765 [Gilliamella apicola]OCG51110.1 hypothetical protein A9G26_05385 [Gilliamella apicola]OCG54116.1 hypothetical protein A9G27_07800 [Gilliamella apicola]
MLGRILNGYYSDLDGDYYITTNPLVRDGIALLYWIGFTLIVFGWLPSMFTLRILKILENLSGK